MSTMPLIVNRRFFAAALAALVVLLFAGCAGKHDTHEEAVKQADGRWKSVRSAMMLEMAEQQFLTKQLDLAEKTVKEAANVDPENPRLHLLAGRIELEKGKLERAYNFFDKSIELTPEGMVFPEPHYYKALVFQRLAAVRPRPRQLYEGVRTGPR